MTTLLWTLAVAFIAISTQIAHDWKQGPVSAEQEQVKGANGPEEPNEKGR